MSEREALEQALEQNPNDPGARIKLARLEAKLWSEDPEKADLGRLAGHLDGALANLPVNRHAQIRQFADQLEQRGADLRGLLANGKFANLQGLLNGGPSAGANGTAETRPSAEAPADAPEPSNPPGPAPTAPSASSSLRAARRSGTSIFDEADIGAMSNADIRGWLADKSFRELATGYALIESFSVRRKIVDLMLANPSRETLLCLVHMLCFEHDEKVIYGIKKQILEFDRELIKRELSYDPHDTQHKSVLVSIIGGLRDRDFTKQLTSALRDRDMNVRIGAIAGLSPLVRRSPEWLKELRRLVKSDREPKVRFAAAKAIQAIDTREAYQELNTIARETKLDKNVSLILEAMHSKFLTDRIEDSRARRKEEESGGEKKSFLGKMFGGGKKDKKKDKKKK